MLGQWVKQPKPVSLLGMKASEYKLSGPLETRYLNGAPQISQQVVGATYIIVEDRNLPPKDGGPLCGHLWSAQRAGTAA
jgi:hypothetical protein